MRDIIGEIAKSLNYSMENLKSAVMNGQIGPKDADLVRRRIERLRQPQPKPAQGGTVVEQGLQQLMSQGQQPSMAMQAPDEVAMAYGGLAELPVNMFDESNYAGGGIVAFSNGDLVEDDEYKGIDYDKLYKKYIEQGLPKSPISSFYKYDAPRPETGWLRDREGRVSKEGLTALDVKKLTDAERGAYGIKDIFGARAKEIEGFKEQAEKTREMNKGMAGLQAAAALLSEPTLARAAAKGFTEAGATMAAGEREYIRDVRDASKLAFEAGAAQQAYNMDLYRNDTARAKENRTRLESIQDQLGAYDNKFIEGIQSRLKDAADAGALYKTRVDSAAADRSNQNISHLVQAINSKKASVMSIDQDLEKRYGKQLMQAQNIINAKNPKPADLEWAKKFVSDYNTMREDAINTENAILEPAIQLEAKRLGLDPTKLLQTGRTGATMAKPSDTTMSGKVDKNNPLLR